MKLLPDACVWERAASQLSSLGHDVIWAGDWEHDPGDLEILQRAHAEQRVLVTYDKDFGELSVHRGIRHAGIIRLVEISAGQTARVCNATVQQYAEDLLRGAIVTVERHRTRVRLPD